MMNVLRRLAPIIFVLLASPSLAGEVNRRSLGLMLGDPMALTLKIPVKNNTFLNTKAGLWTWYFWEEPVIYDTPFISVDYARRFGIKSSRQNWYFGAGLALFFRDNPKDGVDSDFVAAVRLPLGFQFYTKGSFSLSLEVALLHQFAPWYIAQPYGIELNGGLLLQYAF